MNKNEIMQKVTEEYIELSDLQKDKFSRLVNRLLAVNFLCGARKKDRDDYYYIQSHEFLFKNFFILLDYEFYLKKVDSIAYIQNQQHYNHLHLNQLYSVILLLLRKLYFQKTLELQDSDFISITVGELHSEIETTGLYDKRITKTDLKEVYQFLSRYNICERIGDLNDDETRLIIYPTINYILPVSKIDELTNRINSYKKGNADENINKSETD
ncbi:DUF4194 domain-containing protein [[Clostridium] spiroforme]|nr:DUF4194 domain-containing protein [Thomasclavelia spiroformis]MBM6879506.1 DUF4194 domain-containing protein [Thomasclavelia spiroformis]MBM6929567.1 DUF4194 domain-containing protein [Thomasclavelia spiroformis]